MGKRFLFAASFTLFHWCSRAVLILERLMILKNGTIQDFLRFVRTMKWGEWRIFAKEKVNKT